MALRKIVQLQAVETFWVGKRLFVQGSTVVPSNDPDVKGREHLFQPVGQPEVVEQATAAPGETRTRPKRTVKKDG